MDRPPRPLTFAFEGAVYSAYDGDTLASALLANGIDCVSGARCADDRAAHDRGSRRAERACESSKSAVGADAPGNHGGRR
jgi:hypothetical protein